MFKIIGIAIVVFIVALLVYAMTKPDSFRIERSANINAPPEKIFPFINDFHNWIAWSPWEKIDPALKRAYSGTTSGKGTVYEWEGNNQVGHGRMEISDTSPPSHLLIKLDFLKPFEAHNTAEFTLNGAGQSTNVTWAMYGPQPYLAKVMSLFVSMDTMVGGQFETGLANLKTVAEQ
jgi:carbon monoxide dehydrogenase subunit G